MERLLTEFARHADRFRFALRFFTLGSRGPIADELESSGWPVTALGMRPGVTPSMVYRLARLFLHEAIDVVHTHNTKPLLYAAPAARLAGVSAVIHTRHGQRHGATPLQDRMFKLATRCADRLICVSHDSAALCSAGGIDTARIRTIWNGIDLDRFPFTGPAHAGPAVFVGRLSREKDVATLLKAAAIVATRHPSFRLMIAGSGPCAAELHELMETLSIGKVVRFLGAISDVPALLRSASVFVLPSLTEGLPVTVLEAMASGLPVVATRVGGTPEAVEDGRTGLLVPPGDPARLADAILSVLSDPAAAHDMGTQGRRRAAELFDARRMVSCYEQEYAAILCGQAGLAA
jgi:glycosyltransferase involved in cell wall biosynthesis